MYKISIIMPIFNAEKYIERSFQSILNQTMDLNDIEVIMVDDKSTDNTRNIVKSYEKKYSNFKAVYHTQNSGGCAIPRNSGLEVASGEYVMFLDPDDEYDVKMCETLYNRIVNSDAEIVKCNHKLITPNSITIDYQFDKNIEEVEIECKTGVPPLTSSVCNAIHNLNFIKENGLMFPNMKNAEDIVFSINGFFNANKIIVLNNYAGYYYYTNPDVSHAKKPTKNNLDEIFKSYTITKTLIEQNNRTDIYKAFFSQRCFVFFMILLEYPGDKKEYFEKFYEFEKSLNCTLNFKTSWLNMVNKILMKNRISSAVFLFNLLNFIRKTPVIKIYRKFL